MNTIAIALFALVASASALPLQPAVAQGLEKDVPIVSQYNEQAPSGDYRSGFEAANGISIQEEGVQTDVGTDKQAQVVHGQARWVSPEGVPVELSWEAGPEGVRFSGSHIPVAPPPSEEILRSLAYNAAHTYVEPGQVVPKKAL